MYKPDAKELRNQGFWDGRLQFEMGLPYRHSHFSKPYLAGWQDGYEARRAELRKENSDGHD